MFAYENTRCEIDLFTLKIVFGADKKGRGARVEIFFFQEALVLLNVCVGMIIVALCSL